MVWSTLKGKEMIKGKLQHLYDENPLTACPASSFLHGSAQISLYHVIFPNHFI